MTGIPIRVFVSYAHGDDDDFKFIDPFVSKLRALAKVKSARPLEVFVDREGIGWGEDWRERLEQEVQNASVFLPFVTPLYIEREVCRDEFLTFQAEAKSLGVTGLILPVVPLHSPAISKDSEDEIARYAAEKQYELLEAGLLAGFESATWLTVMARIADRLLDAVAKSEAILAQPTREPSGSEPGPVQSESRGEGETRGPTSTSGMDLGGELSLDEPGLMDLMADMGDTIDSLNVHAQALTPALTEFGTIAASPEVAPPTTPQGMQAWSIRLSRAFQNPSDKIEIHGLAMYEDLKHFDQLLKSMKKVAASSGSMELNNTVNDNVSTLLDKFGDLSNVADGMEELMSKFIPLESFSAAIRNSLRPARRGLTAVRDTVRLTETMRSQR
ncbi:toll/interleukin-1 receptor domain-containing protein [Frigoribacterium sp. 2355]